MLKTPWRKKESIRMEGALRLRRHRIKEVASFGLLPFLLGRKPFVLYERNIV